MYKTFLFSLLTAGLAMGAESFEKLPNGDLTSGAFEYGQLSAEPGNVEIFNKARTGSKCLRIKGGTGRSVTLKLASPTEKEVRSTFWMERWTRKDPFAVKVLAVTAAGEKPIKDISGLGVGGFNHKIELALPKGTTAIRLVADTPDNAGVMIDDFMMMIGKMKLGEVKAHNPGVWPVMKRASFNPVVKILVQTEGAEDPVTVDGLELTVDNPDQVARVTLRSGSANGMDFKGSVEYGSAKPGKNGKFSFFMTKHIVKKTTKIIIRRPIVIHILYTKNPSINISTIKITAFKEFVHIHIPHILK